MSTWRAAFVRLVVVVAAASGWVTHAGAGSGSSAPDDVEAWVLPDPSGHIGIEDAVSAFEVGQGSRVDSDRVRPLGAGRAVWFRLQIPAAAREQDLVFVVPFPGIDHVQVFRRSGLNSWGVQQAGDSIAVRDWPIAHRYPAFPLAAVGRSAEIVYLRVQHSHPISVPWKLLNAADFAQQAKNLHLVMGALVGVVLLAAALSLMNGLSWRDPIHHYYAVHVVLVGLSMMTTNGLAGEHLWPGSARWNDLAVLVFPTLTVAWLGIFSAALLFEHGARAMARMALAQAATGLVIALALLGLGRSYPLFIALSIYIALGLFVLAGLLGRDAMRHSQAGWWMATGVALIAAGSVFPTLRNLSLVPVTGWTQNALHFAWLLELPIMLSGLFFRSRARRDSRLRLHSLAHIDPLSGVDDHQTLMRRLREVIHGEMNTAALLRLRVANLEEIRNEYGKEAGEAAVVRAAECLALEARAGDTIAREEGGDLVLLMRNRSSREDLALACRNIIARGLKPSRLLPPGVALAMRASGACGPLPQLSPSQLLGTLAQSLEDLASDPRRRVVRILEPTTPNA